MTETQPMRGDPFEDRLAAVLLGTAVGDAVGLPTEGLSRRRRQRLFLGPWRHRLLYGHGMISDDTEHTLLVAQSLLTHPDDAEKDACRAFSDANGDGLHAVDFPFPPVYPPLPSDSKLLSLFVAPLAQAVRPACGAHPSPRTLGNRPTAERLLRERRIGAAGRNS